MVLALKELSIRGDISTTVDYISKLIELEDFIDNRIDTAWLDGIIQANSVKGIFDQSSSNRRTIRSGNQEDSHLYLVLGAAIVAYDNCLSGEKQFSELLQKGQLPPRSLLKMSHSVELILTGIKYRMVCTRKGQNSFKIAVENNANGFVVTNVRILSDGGYLIEIGGASHVAYLTNKGDVATGMRLNVAGFNVAFSPDYDPTSLRTDVAGKLVKKLVTDGAHVKKGEPYAEIEVMKMFMPLKVEESGIVQWNVNEGASIAAGDLLATLQLDNPENVAVVSVFEGALSVAGWGASSRPADAKRPHLVLRATLDQLEGAMTGYVMEKEEVDIAMEDLAVAVTDPSLPMLEIGEQLSVLSGRISTSLQKDIHNILGDFGESVRSDSGIQIRYVLETALVIRLWFHIPLTSTMYSDFPLKMSWR
jgi:acetyl-CoA carboxylase/biotin carboxylase 1